jgi:hypothetical protein
MGTLEIPVRGYWRIAEDNEAPEAFPKLSFTVSDEDIASRKGPAGRVWGHDPVRRLALSHISIRSKCHESVMSLVMVQGGLTPSDGSS